MAEDDPLAKYRRPGHAPIPTARSGAGAAPALAKYEAFAEMPGPQRVWLKCGPRNCDEAPAYGWLTNIITDNWSRVTLCYSIPTVVEIIGECLGPVAEALIKGSCAWVEVYDAARHIDPPEGMVIIREINILRTRPEETTEH